MSNFTARQVHEEESLSQSSDEKMDTSSETFRSQDTPNSNLSSELDDRSDTHVLRLQNPENGVLRLSEPQNDNVLPKQELSDSFLNKMSGLHLDSPLRPQNVVLNDGKKTSLVLTTNHPLMVTSPDVYPDVIPKKLAKEDQDLSLSSIEDEKPADNGFELYSPDTNNSKNNLYYSDNFTAAGEGLTFAKPDSRPDVAMVRRKIIPRFVDPPPQQSAPSRLDNAVQRVHASTPKTSFDEQQDHDPRIDQWCTSTQVRTAPNFDLPIELTANVAMDNVLDSPDVLSLSTRSSLSPYEARADPATGRVSLRPPARAASHSPHTTRRKIEIPEEDRCSLDSVSVSMESEDEPPELDPQLELQEVQSPPSDDEVKRSKSTNTCSECSDDPIPEYSAAEEFHNERSYVSVQTGDTHATCDMKVIEPYKRVLSHGGYDLQGSAIIVFSACHLPDSARTDYRYVMDNLFLYVMWTLDRLIGSEYILVYLHGSAGARRLPSCRWLLECYRLIDRRLRKSLKHLYLVHPTFWLKSLVLITKPFVSSKFFHKLSYVQDLEQLSRLVPVQANAIPEIVKQYDAQRR